MARFSKIEAGMLELEAVEFDPRALVEQSVELLSGQARQKGLELACVVSTELPARLQGDPGRLRQVLLNLVGNALKFTEHGRIQVRAGLPELQYGQALLRVKVCDTGPGIGAELKAKLFQPFTQADTSTIRRLGGTGLGLAISKRLVERMNGEIGVESAPEQGATFWFTVRLPVCEAPAAEAAAPADPAVRRAPGREITAAPGRKRVLVAEDHPVNRKVVERMLNKLGFEVDLVGDGHQAVAAAGHFSYDVILMDCQMPGPDGLEATRQIRQRQQGGRCIPISALTASALSGDRERCLEAGMDDHLAKPITGTALQRVLESWLKASPAPAQNPTSCAPRP